MAPTWLEKRNDWTGPRYSSSVFGSLRSVDQLLLAYGPQPSFDDMAWYGLAYARSFWIANSNYNTQSPSRIYEVTQKKEFLQRSKDIFDWVIIYYLTLILSVVDIVSKLSFIFHSLFLLNKYSYEVTCWQLWWGFKTLTQINGRFGRTDGTIPPAGAASGSIRFDLISINHWCKLELWQWYVRRFRILNLLWRQHQIVLSIYFIYLRTF